MSIYQLMKDDWKVYCLMSSIIYIEEMSKPTEHIQIKTYKNRVYECLCFHSIRLKMKDPEFVGRYFKLTKIWEEKKGVKLIGKSFTGIRKENWSKQDYFYLSPSWLNLILTECGRIPNKYSLETAIKRINHLKQYEKIPINNKRNLFGLLLKNKKLAAGAFIISMDLECRGMQQGAVRLTMSEKYKDFLEAMLKIAKKWGWTNNNKLFEVCMDYNKKLGINASPQYEFGISIRGLKEIYALAGPLANSHKNKCISFHIQRSMNYINLGANHKKKNTKEKIRKYLEKNKNAITTNIQFVAGVRTDVILDHLHNLERKNKVIKERKGKRYIWNIK